MNKKDSIFKEKKHSGYLAFFVRSKRKNSPLVTNKRPYKKRRSESDESEDETSGPNDEIERAMVILQHSINSTEVDRQRIISAMSCTFKIRRAWITRESPSTSTILEKYSRFIEMPNLVYIYSQMLLNE
jgi:hypothetical protein